MARKKGKCFFCGKETCRPKYEKCLKCSNLSGRNYENLGKWALRGAVPWNKGLTQETDNRVKYERPTLFKKGMTSLRKGMKSLHVTGENNPFWKGDDVGYDALHHWVNRWKETATNCVVCASIGGIRGCHWANLSGEYKRDLNDFISLCPKCHKAWDLGNLPINLFEWVRRINQEEGGGLSCRA